MIITNANTEVIYFKVYEDYFNYPRNKTTPHRRSSSYCKKTDSSSGIFFIEYDFYIADEFTKEPFFVYRVKNSFSFIVENEEQDLIDFSRQKAKFRDDLIAFIRDNSLGYHFEDLDRMFYLHDDLNLIIGQNFYSSIKN